MKLKTDLIKLNQKNRLYHLNVPVIGLTGGIATGKSTVAKFLIQKNIPVINADHLVKEIYRMDIVRKHIQSNHPEVIDSGEIQFPKLREKVFNSPVVKKEIETLIYSHLEEAFQKALSQFKDPQVIIYDVPLLYERQMEKLFDLNVLVYAPRKIQRIRLMSRDNHLEAQADKILDQQIDIEEKRVKADVVIDNSGSEEELAAEMTSFLQQYFEII